MNLFTIGFTKKSAESFFTLIKEHKITLLVDIRLNNKSQLAGFSKGEDLKYFLMEICGCEYKHCEEYAPAKEILDGYKKKQFDWDEYVLRYTSLMEGRHAAKKFLENFKDFENICLLCSEPTPEFCHRRLFAEMIAAKDQSVEIIHI